VWESLWAGRIGRMGNWRRWEGIRAFADERAKAGAACCRSGYPGMELSLVPLTPEC